MKMSPFKSMILNLYYKSFISLGFIKEGWGDRCNNLPIIS